MLKRLRYAATTADLASVEAILQDQSFGDDPVGQLQFARRAEELKLQLDEIDSEPSTGAEVGLFFAGRPVIGSHGIQVDFGSKAVSEFQNLVSQSFAASAGGLGARGPVPHRDRSGLMLTDVSRGSFGFILEQVENPGLMDGPLKGALSHAVDLVFRVSSPDQEAFEQLTEEVDSRVFGALKAFFHTLDDAGATLRVVEDSREFTLHREEVERGRERTEKVRFVEDELNAHGSLYVLPAAGRFELHQLDGEVLRGAVAPNCLAALTGGGTEVLPGFIGRQLNARLRRRKTLSPGLPGRPSFTLLSVG